MLYFVYLIFIFSHLTRRDITDFSIPKVIKAIDEGKSDNEQTGNLDDVKRKLHFCDGLLLFWRKCVECVFALKKIRALHVASLCNILPETIKIIFEHCKARYHLYRYISSNKRDTFTGNFL